MTPSDRKMLTEIHAAVMGRATHEQRELLERAMAVVVARHYRGDDGWDRLKNAIGELEDLVGRPK